MSDAASFDAIMQCNLLEVFCEALGAAIFVTDKLDELSFASVRLLQFFSIPDSAIASGNRARDLYGALFDAGCRFGASGCYKDKNREDWIGERVAIAWKERVDTIEQSGPDRWFRVVSRRFASGLGLTVIQDISEHKKKEMLWRAEQERVRMTEEILDTLPVAVAIKDRNLNYVAVNQQFCKMMRLPRDVLLGCNVSDFFEPGLAGVIEQAEWHLLATGEDRRSVFKIIRPQSEPSTVLHRTRRIGRPGHHYISLSFEEIPVTAGLAGDMLVSPDVTMRVDDDDKFVATKADRVAHTVKKKAVTFRKAVYVNSSGSGDDHIVREAKVQGVELCIIRSEAEFAAFLPAIHDAGIVLDLVVIAPNAALAFTTLTAKHGIRHHMLSSDANVVETILDVVDPSRPRISVLQSNPEQHAEDELPAATDQKSGTLDILAIEDTPLNRMVLEQIFESLGLNFAVVESGRDAIDKIAEFCPHIILADITLPDMPACDLLPALEPLMKQRGINPPVIGVIAIDSADQRQIAKHAGFADVLVKPLSPEAIDTMLRKHLFHEPYDRQSSTRSAA